MSGLIPSLSPMQTSMQNSIHTNGSIHMDQNLPPQIHQNKIAVSYSAVSSLPQNSIFSSHSSTSNGDTVNTNNLQSNMQFDHNLTSQMLIPGNNDFTAKSPTNLLNTQGQFNSHTVQNGPHASLADTQTKLNGQESMSNLNGLTKNSAKYLFPHVSNSQWPSQIPPIPETTQNVLQQSPVIASILPSGVMVSPVLHTVSDAVVPDNTSSVPSSGLPLPYSGQNARISPQVTPGPSQPASARSSRNPSPISTQRYDFMEGQFSNKPSPSNSTTNLLQQSYSPSRLPNSLGCPTTSSAYNSPNAAISGYVNQHMQQHSPVVPAGQNVSPLATQPQMAYSPIPCSVGSTSPRPRYPQQVGYNSSPVPSQPMGLQPPSPMYNSPYQPTASDHTVQGGMPDGPVGGLSGYDPELHAKMAGTSVHSSFSRLWGNESVNLLQDRNILPALPLEPPKPQMPAEKPNCSASIFRSTLTKVPDSSALLQKSRLPFGILIHPFCDIANLPVIQCNTIVRCRNCRTYINPFVSFVDQRRWKCNLCFRINDLPEEFLYDPITRSYGDPSRRPEMKNATIEFIAPSDYMLRPPQPAAYLFVLDVSHGACEIGYIQMFCKTLLESLEDLPGDTRTKIGFITFDGSIHFYSLAEGLSKPHMLIVSDIEDGFLPSPDNLLVNVHESKALIQAVLEDLPKRFSENGDTNSCLGAALQVAYKLMAPVGGRVTAFQTCLVNHGPGNLKNREDPNQRAAKDVANVGPATDFFKKLSLECSGQQIAVDLFLLCSMYIDIATISCISKYSSGGIYYYPGFHHELGKSEAERFKNDMKRYLTRRIGFESVMRIRCTRGLSIHTFHGNFFVRSTDLLSLPNVNPDAGFGMQIAIEENLTECSAVCFQAAVLYTSSNGERRIRVHTLSLPVVSILCDIWGGADQEAIIGLVAKMAVDRCVTSSLSDARDALINVCVDLLGAVKLTMQSSQMAGSLIIPYSTRLIPLFILGLLKHVAFRTGVSTKLDERVFAMDRMKTLPLQYLMKYVYPTLYPVHALDDKNAISQDDDAVIPQPVILQLSHEKIDRHGVYVLDTIDAIYLYIGRAVNDHFCLNVLGVTNYGAIPDKLTSLPELCTMESVYLRCFITWLQDQRPASSPIIIIKEDSNARHLFLQYMVDDRTDSLFSYYEFLQHLRQQISK